MKSFLFLGFLMVSLNVFACPEISGKYLCPEEAASEMALGAREITFKKNPLIDIFSVTVGDSATLFELDSWNPEIDPNTGDINHNVETMAECKDDKIIFYEKVTESDGEVSVTLEGSYEVKLNAEGMNLRMMLEGDEFFNFDCKKQ